MTRPTPVQEFTAAAITVCALSWALVGWAVFGAGVRWLDRHAAEDFGGPDCD